MCSLKYIPRHRAQRNDLVLAALGVSEGDEAALKIDILPFEFEDLSAPHTGKQGNFHHFASYRMRVFLDCL